MHNATVAVNSMTVNWNAEAVKAAKEYLSMSAFSCSGLIAQLDSPDGDQFTVAQATYGARYSGNGCLLSFGSSGSRRGRGAGSPSC